MMSEIELRCLGCGRRATVPRFPEDPPNAAHAETDECDICEAAAGGFGGIYHYDSEGKMIDPGANPFTPIS